MDHDDAHPGLDELSRLFETGSAPLPVVPPEEQVAPAATAPRHDEVPSAFGQSLPPAYAPPFVAPQPTVGPPPLVAPSFGTPASGNPLAGRPAGPPYSPPPLVPAAPTPSAGPPPAPADVLVEQPVAPAFGGVPIAAPRPRGPEPAPAAPPPTPIAAPAPTAPEAAPPSVAESGPPSAVPTPTHAPSTPVPSTPAPIGSTPPGPYPGAGPLLPGGSVDDIVDDDQVARSTLAEKIFFVLAIVLPPIGLVGTAVAAVGSMRRRGWVTGLLRAGLAIGIVMSVVSAGGAYVGYKQFRQQQAHAQTVAASTAFCAAFAKDKTLATGDGGWPQPAGSIADSLTAMQAYVDRWNALAKISPEGVQQGVANVAVAGAEVIKTVQVQRTVDDAEDRPILASAMSSAGIAQWRADYCE